MAFLLHLYKDKGLKTYSLMKAENSESLVDTLLKCYVIKIYQFLIYIFKKQQQLKSPWWCGGKVTAGGWATENMGKLAMWNLHWCWIESATAAAMEKPHKLYIENTKVASTSIAHPYDCSHNKSGVHPQILLYININFKSLNISECLFYMVKVMRI